MNRLDWIELAMMLLLAWMIYVSFATDVQPKQGDTFKEYKAYWSAKK